MLFLLFTFVTSDYQEGNEGEKKQWTGSKGTVAQLDPSQISYPATRSLTRQPPQSQTAGAANV